MHALRSGCLAELTSLGKIGQTPARVCRQLAGGSSSRGLSAGSRRRSMVCSRDNSQHHLATH
jgi:hypothetical protein